MADEKKDETGKDDNLVSGEEIQATVVDDGLDLDIVDEFDESDFDEDFDDDFEEEIEGEYDLEDDKYGKEVDENFGHLTDPTRTKKKAAEPNPKEDAEGEEAPAKKSAADKKGKVTKKVAAKKKATGKKAPAKKAKKKPARKK